MGTPHPVFLPRFLDPALMAKGDLRIFEALDSSWAFAALASRVQIRPLMMHSQVELLPTTSQLVV